MSATGNVWWVCVLLVDVPQLPCWSSLYVLFPSWISPPFYILWLFRKSFLWLPSSSGQVATSLPWLFHMADVYYFFFPTYGFHFFPASAGIFSVGANRAWLFFIFFHQVSQVGLWHLLIFDFPHLFSCCSLRVRWLRLAGWQVINEYVGVLARVGTKAL